MQGGGEASNREVGNGAAKSTEEKHLLLEVESASALQHRVADDVMNMFTCTYIRPCHTSFMSFCNIYACNYILQQIMASVNKYLTVFKPPYKEYGVERVKWVNYRPVTQITNSSAIEFNIAGTSADYLLLSKSKLHVKATIKHIDVGEQGASDTLFSLRVDCAPRGEQNCTGKNRERFSNRSFHGKTPYRIQVSYIYS